MNNLRSNFIFNAFLTELFVGEIFYVLLRAIAFVLLGEIFALDFGVFLLLPFKVGELLLTELF
jgi:hypothetical protein